MRPWPVLPLAFSLACAATNTSPDGDSVDVSGKADGWGSALAADAMAYAEAFDFEAESDTEIDRGVAADTGPTWVRRAFALHHAWEDNDLGVARLYRWTVSRHRVWAIRTSTDGDESFIELFNADGAWLATGVGGYGADPTTPGEYRAVIQWDAAPGGVRDEVAPRDIVPEIARFYRAADEAQSAASPSGATLGVAEARLLADALLDGSPTVESADGWDRASALRVLADPAVRWTSAARSYVEGFVDFYRGDYPTLGAISTPNIETTLGLPADLRNTIRFARATNRDGAEARLGHRTMNLLAGGLGALSASALPTSTKALASHLVAAGATGAQADAAIEALGANADGARVFAGSLFTFDANYQPVLTEGTAWFVMSPARSYVSLLHLVDPLTSLATRESTARAAIQQATGTSRSFRLVQVRERETGVLVDLEFARPDHGRLGVVLDLPSSNGAPDVWIGSYSPSIANETRGWLREVASASTGNPVDIVGVVEGNASTPTVLLYRTGVGVTAPITLASVDPTTGRFASITPASISNARLETLALSATRHHAEHMVDGLGDLPLLEVLLQTAWSTTADLVPTTAADAEESAVGFDPTTEYAQYMLPHVWGDNAVFVTFTKSSTARIEDFN